MLALSIPNSVTLAYTYIQYSIVLITVITSLVDRATKCLATADSYVNVTCVIYCIISNTSLADFSNQFFAVVAFVIVSSVVNV